MVKANFEVEMTPEEEIAYWRARYFGVIEQLEEAIKRKQMFEKKVIEQSIKLRELGYEGE